MDSWIGQTLNDRFRVESRLGQGGMAAVYLASDLRLSGRTVVVKHPLREADRVSSGLSDDDLRRRFAQEVEGLTRLDDVPGVVPILDQGVHQGTPFYVMRHMAGGSLADLLLHGPQAPGQALTWLAPVAQTLDRLHERGVLHRDVKPENLLFDQPPTGPKGSQSQAHLSDFGIVKELAAQWGTTGQVNTGIGTPGYMAPEQLLQDAEPDGRADQYALAATLYHALTGSRPQYETTGGRPVRARPAPGDVEARSGRKRLTPVSRLAGHVPAACSAVIERALAREAEDRYPTCGAFVAAFEAALNASDGTPAAAGAATAVPTRQAATPRQEAPERPSVAPARAGGGRRWMLVLLALAALAGIGYAVLPSLGRRPATTMGPGAAPAPAAVPAPAPAGSPQPGGKPPGPAVAPPLPPALPSKPVDGPVIGYAEVQRILGSYLRTATAAPHQDFWTLTYAEFVAFQFPFAEGEDGMIRLVTPGDGVGSNLIKALKDGEGITVRLADGREEVRNIKRMPPRGKKRPTEEDLAKLIKWIDAGCPEEGRP